MRPLKPWEVQALSHSELLWEEKKYTRTVSNTHQECFWDFECKSTYFQTVLTSTSPKRIYNQTLLYGHLLNTDTSFITDRTVCFLLGGKALIFFLNSTPLITNTLLTLSLLGGVREDDANFIVYCFVCHKLYKANKKNYFNSHSEEAQEKPPGY